MQTRITLNTLPWIYTPELGAEFLSTVLKTEDDMRAIILGYLPVKFMEFCEKKVLVGVNESQNANAIAAQTTKHD